MAERITVTIDPDLAELIPGYLRNRQDDVTRLCSSLELEDYDRIRLLGHSMKGSGGGYGFDEISAIGSRIEVAALTRDVVSIRTAVAELEDYLRRVDVVAG
jgi:HPt (histidine-containing phosphotransfer) domain-containing protein